MATETRNINTRHQSVPVLVVAVGVRGRMWARILASEPGVHVVGYVDPDPGARAWVQETFGPDIHCFAHHADALSSVTPTLAVVATPPMERRALCMAWPTPAARCSWRNRSLTISRTRPRLPSTVSNNDNAASSQ